MEFQYVDVCITGGTAEDRADVARFLERVRVAVTCFPKVPATVAERAVAHCACGHSRYETIPTCPRCGKS